MSQIEAAQTNPDADADAVEVEVEVEIEIEDAEDLEIEGCPSGDPTTSQQQHHNCNGEALLRAWVY
jgi:hypothetical protein